MQLGLLPSTEGCECPRGIAPVSHRPPRLRFASFFGKGDHLAPVGFSMDGVLWFSERSKSAIGPVASEWVAKTLYTAKAFWRTVRLGRIRVLLMARFFCVPRF